MTLPLSKEQIEAIQARAEKATPGPWAIIQDKGHLNEAYWIGFDPISSIAEVRHGAEDEEYGGSEAERANAELIANARTDIPALCQMALRAIELEAEKQELAMQALSLSGELAALQSELTATRKALEGERERCAGICEKYIEFCDRDNPAAHHKRGAAQTLASRIRALPSPQVKK